MQWVHDKAGLRVLARNKHADKGIPSLLKKMTGMVVSGGFDGARMAFPSNMYFQKSNGELSISEFSTLAFYLDLAVKEVDPVERLSLIIAGLVEKMII